MLFILFKVIGKNREFKLPPFVQYLANGKQSITHSIFSNVTGARAFVYCYIFYTVVKIIYNFIFQTILLEITHIIGEIQVHNTLHSLDK